MITRRAKLREVIAMAREGGMVSHYARVTFEGIDAQILITPSEHAWAERALSDGKGLVMTLTEEATP